MDDVGSRNGWKKTEVVMTASAAAAAAAAATAMPVTKLRLWIVWIESIL